MNELTAHIRRCVSAREANTALPRDPTADGGTTALDTLELSRSSLALPMCALCRSAHVSPFLAGLPPTASAAAEAGKAAPPPHVSVSDLCDTCFRIAFRAIVRPLLADEIHRSRVATRLDELAASTAATDAALVAEAKRLRPLRDSDQWTCFRCTFAGNTGGDASCRVCATAAPHVTECTVCKQRLSPKLIGMPCTAAAAPPGPGGRRAVHAVWACATCTYTNTIEAEVCAACFSRRGWQCARCTCINTSQRTSRGERCCNVCGQIDSTMSVEQAAQYGLNPADVLRERQQAAEQAEGRKRLDLRLCALRLSRSAQLGDGNCQFRALAHQLFGRPELHMFVRQTIVQHMRHKGRAALEPFCDSAASYDAYLAAMATDACWGDHLTLKAAADALGCHVHIISSAPEAWHYHIRPQSASSGSRAPAAPVVVTNQSVSLGPATPLDATVMLPVRAAVEAIRRELDGTADAGHGGDAAGGGLATTRNLCADWPLDAEDGFPHVFLVYEEPVHYDDVAVESDDGGPPRALGRHTVDMCRVVGAVISAIVAEELDWVDADVRHDPDWVDVQADGESASPENRS